LVLTALILWKKAVPAATDVIIIIISIFMWLTTGFRFVSADHSNGPSIFIHTEIVWPAD
jgi:hypothetical protein